MIKMSVLTPWKEVLKDESAPDKGSQNWPEVMADYPLDPGEVYVDSTSQANVIPDPNNFACELIVSESKREVIAADSKYFILTEEVV